MTKTRSETIFERFLNAEGIPFRPLPTGATRTPDYAVTIGGVEIAFELKELAGASKFKQEPVHSGKLGQLIRNRIKKGSDQIQSAANEGKPTVLLIFNNRDPAQLFGTDNLDFEHAMYGELTVVVETSSGNIVDRFHGGKKSFQPGTNTSFSALGRLKDDRGSISVTLFENLYAKTLVPDPRHAT